MTPTMWTAFIGLGGPFMAAAAVVIVRRSGRENETQDSLASAIEKVTDANVSITSIVTSLMEPMQEEIERHRLVEVELRTALAEMKRRVEHMDSRFTSAVQYIRSLHRLIRDSDIDLPEPPSALDGFNLHD